MIYIIFYLICNYKIYNQNQQKLNKTMLNDPTLLQYYVYKFLKNSKHSRNKSSETKEDIDIKRIFNTDSTKIPRNNFRIDQFKFQNRMSQKQDSKELYKERHQQSQQRIFKRNNKYFFQDITFNVKRKRTYKLLERSRQLKEKNSKSFYMMNASGDDQNGSGQKDKTSDSKQKVQNYPQSQQLRQRFPQFIKKVTDKNNETNHKQQNKNFSAKVSPFSKTFFEEKTFYGLSIKRMELETSFPRRSEDISKNNSNNKSPPPVASKKKFKTRSGEKKRPQQKIKKHSMTLKQDFTDIIFQEKSRRYRQFLFKIYFANGVYLDIKECSEKYERKKQKKYQVYIGSGNNRNLIRSIIKKRWWWNITNELTEATNFVWTQIKIPSFLEKQKQSSWYIPQHKNFQYTPPIGSNLIIQNQDSQINCEKIMHKLDYQCYKTYLNSFKKRPYEFQNRIKLLGKSPMRQLSGTQKVHNHFEFNTLIGNKKALLKNMLKYYNFMNISSQDYNIPTTFHIKSLNDKELKRFMIHFKEKQRKGKKNNIWIVKPGQNTNRGVGIQVHKNLNDILKVLQNTERTHIVQQYICNLLLYKRRKFDIRTYVLITQISGCLKAYWYKQGYIRTSSQLYRLDNLQDSMIHLTNDAIQKEGENYGMYEPGNKLSYAQFQKYIDTYMYDSNFSIRSLVSKMKEIATDVIRASYFKIDPKCRENNFEIFGLDFLVNRNFSPILLEVNTNPCLQLSCPLLERIIPKMVDEAFRIALDPLFPPTPCPYSYKSCLSDNLCQNNRFELIFDSQFDRILELQQYMPVDQQEINYEQDNQTYDNEGEQFLFDVLNPIINQ